MYHRPDKGIAVTLTDEANISMYERDDHQLSPAYILQWDSDAVYTLMCIPWGSENIGQWLAR